MSRFASWASRVLCGLDRVVAQLEDHDALVRAALSELEDAERRAEKELARARSAGSALRDRLEEAQSTARRLREYAARERTDGAALELLREARRARERAGHLQRRIDEHVRLEAHLGDRVATLSERVQALRHQHDSLRARTARSEVTPADAAEAASIEALFERWDESLARATTFDDDPFDALTREEDERALHEELRALRSERRKGTP